MQIKNKIIKTLLIEYENYLIFTKKYNENIVNIYKNEAKNLLIYLKENKKNDLLKILKIDVWFYIIEKTKNSIFLEDLLNTCLNNFFVFLCKKYRICKCEHLSKKPIGILIGERNIILSDYKIYLTVLKRYSKGTATHYYNEVDKLLYYLFLNDFENLKDLKKRDVEKFVISERKKRKISNITTNLLISCLNNFFVFLHEKYEICDIHLPHLKSQSKIPKIINSKKMLKLFKDKYPLESEQNWIKIRNYALATLIYSTGMRISEALDFTMYDFGNKWIRVVNGKGMKSREVPTNQFMTDTLRRYIDCCPYSILNGFWYTNTGKKLTKSTANKSIISLFGKKFNPHYFRHAFATHLVQNGCELMVVKDFLGHSSLHTTSIYTHVEPAHLAITVNNCHPMKSGLAI